MKKIKYSKLIVLLVILLNIVFTSGVLFISYSNNNEVPEALIVSWFAFTGTELLSLAGIKITGIIHDNDEDSNEEEQEEK